MPGKVKQKLKLLLILIVVTFSLCALFSFHKQTQAVSDVARAYMEERFPGTTIRVEDVDLIDFTQGWRIRYYYEGGRIGRIILDTRSRFFGLPLFGDIDEIYVVKNEFVDPKED